MAKLDEIKLKDIEFDEKEPVFALILAIRELTTQIRRLASK